MGTPILWNPSDKSAVFNLSNGNKTAADGTADGSWDSLRADATLPSDRKVYWEIVVTYSNPSGEFHAGAGIGNSSFALNNHIGASANGWGLLVRSTSTNMFNNGTPSADYATIASGGRWMFAWDPSTGKLWIGQVGTGWLNSGNPAAGTGALASGLSSTGWYIAGTSYGGRGTLDLYTSSADMTGTPPSGFEFLVSSAKLAAPFRFLRAA